jgi:hypothetical protein
VAALGERAAPPIRRARAISRWSRQRTRSPERSALVSISASPRNRRETAID